MKRLMTISFIALFAISFSGFAQEITVSMQSEYTPHHYYGTTAVLYDQTVGTNTNAYSSQEFGAGNATFTNQAADDFTATDTWTVDQVVVNGSYSLTGPADGFNVFFYSDAAGIPGTEVYSELVAPYVYDGLTTWTITMVTPAVLPAGDYWVSVQCRMDFSPGGQWFFAQVDGAFGNVAQWQNPLDGFATGCITWAPIQGCVAAVGTDMSFAILGTAGGGGGGLFPEVLYYTFDEAGSDSTENLADPGSGDAWANLVGAMTMGSAGQFGSALIGTGASSGTDYVDTGWLMDIGTSDWTISAWLDILDESALHYIFGEGTNSFRCFYGGVAPPSGVVLRGTGMTDVPVSGLIPGPGVVHFVYDSSVPEIRGYLNGVFQIAVAQTALNLISGAGDVFKVGSRTTSTGLAAGELFDEFRFYSRALDSAEVANTWNVAPIPVELTSFTASIDDNDVTLNWETASEINNSGFQVEKKSNGEYESIGFVPGFGSTTEPRAYSFSDVNLSAGTYSYRLKQIDYDGTFEYSDPVEVDILVPDVYSLHQNYPNPFNPSTKITFTIAANALVTLKVFDVLGQEVMTLINQDLTAGVHTYDFDAAGFNSGVYFYRIEANGIDGTNFTNVKKMILLK